MASFDHSGSHTFRRVIPILVICLSGLISNQIFSSPVNAWSFGESPTAAFAVDGFAGTSGEGTGQSQVIEDSSGNIYRYGSTAGTIDVDPGPGSVLVGDAVTDSVFYIAKYTATGSFLWAHDWEPSGSNELVISRASVSPDGYVVLGGYLSGPTGVDMNPTAGVDSVTTTTTQPFLLRLNADGSYGWGTSFSVSAGGSGNIHGVAVSSTGAITAVVSFSNTLTLFGTPVASAGSSDVVVVRLNANASALTWRASISGTGLEWIDEMKLSTDGRVVVAGGFASSTVTVTGADAATATVTRSVSASTNTSFVSLSNSGVVQYAISRSLGATDNYVKSTALTSSGILVAQLNTGELVEVSTAGVLTSKGTLGAQISSMTFVSSGHLVGVGFFGGTSDFDPTTAVENRTPAGFDDGFILRLTSSLSFSSLQTFGTATLDEVNSVTPSLLGGYFVSGRTFGSALNLSNTTHVGTYTRSGSADSFGFVIRFDASGTTGTTTTTTTTVPIAAAPTSASYTAGNKNVSVRWNAVAGASTYKVLSASGATFCSTGSDSCKISSLTNGKIYTLTIKSVNSAGISSSDGKTLKVVPGFALKITSYKVKKSPLLTSIVTSPSKGARKWQMLSGKCLIRSGRLVMPSKSGSCRIKLSVGKWSSYPAMSTTVTVAVTR